MESTGTFTYRNPMTVHFGSRSARHFLARDLRESDLQRPMVVTASSLVGSAALAYVLDAAGLTSTTAPVATANAHTPLEEVVALANSVREIGCDSLLAVGGGSVIDAAKLASVLAQHPGATRIDVAEVASILGAASLALPTLTVSTTLSGAELCGGAGYSAVTSKTKIGNYIPAMTPQTVFLDPQATINTPETLWTSSGVRCIDHAIEGLVGFEWNPLSAGLCVSAVSRLRTSLLGYARNPQDLSSKAESQIGMWESYSLPVSSGRGLSHTLGKAIGSTNGIPHSLTSCVILPNVIRFHATNPTSAGRLLPLARTLQLPAGSPEIAARSIADEIESLVQQLGLPSNLKPFQVPDQALKDAAESTAARLGMDSRDAYRILACSVEGRSISDA